MQIKPEGSDEETALKGIAAMEDFYHAVQMPVNMSELGIHPTDEQLHEMAVRASKACGGSKGSAKVLCQDDMEKIYRMAL